MIYRINDAPLYTRVPFKIDVNAETFTHEDSGTYDPGSTVDTYIMLTGYRPLGESIWVAGTCEGDHQTDTVMDDDDLYVYITTPICDFQNPQ